MSESFWTVLSNFSLPERSMLRRSKRYKHILSLSFLVASIILPSLSFFPLSYMPFLFSCHCLCFAPFSSLLSFLFPACLNAQQEQLQNEGQLTGCVFWCMNRVLFEYKLLSFGAGICSVHVCCQILFLSYVLDMTIFTVTYLSVIWQRASCSFVCRSLSWPLFFFSALSSLSVKAEVASPTGTRGRDRAVLIVWSSNFLCSL